MLEHDVIQYRGFHNLYNDKGEAVGFQIRVRSTYYRGIWLSQLRPGRVIVDGETFPWQDIVWQIGGVDYKAPEMAELGHVFWEKTKPAVLKVMKPGGLSQGFHTVSVRFGYSASYMPPEMDTFTDDTETSGFGGGTYTRENLIIV